MSHASHLRLGLPAAFEDPRFALTRGLMKYGEASPSKQGRHQLATLRMRELYSEATVDFVGSSPLQEARLTSSEAWGAIQEAAAILFQAPPAREGTPKAYSLSKLQELYRVVETQTAAMTPLQVAVQSNLVELYRVFTEAYWRDDSLFLPLAEARDALYASAGEEEITRYRAELAAFAQALHELDAVAYPSSHQETLEKLITGTDFELVLMLSEAGVI